jgi:hypothetical protein
MEGCGPVLVAAVIYDGVAGAQLVKQQLQGAGLTKASCNMQQRVPAPAPAATEAICYAWM